MPCHHGRKKDVEGRISVTWNLKSKQVNSLLRNAIKDELGLPVPKDGKTALRVVIASLRTEIPCSAWDFRLGELKSAA